MGFKNLHYCLLLILSIVVLIFHCGWIIFVDIRIVTLMFFQYGPQTIRYV